MDDIVLIAIIIGFLVLGWCFNKLSEKYTYPHDWQTLPQELQKGLRLAKPYDDGSDSGSEESSEPDPVEAPIARGIGHGKVVETHGIGQVADAQGEHYLYGRAGCDVFIS